MTLTINHKCKEKYCRQCNSFNGTLCKLYIKCSAVIPIIRYEEILLK